jgi:hypothetical protein
MLAELVCFSIGFVVGYYGLPTVITWVKGYLPSSPTPQRRSTDVVEPPKPTDPPVV